MKSFSNLKRASVVDVEQWLTRNLELSEAQKNMIKFSPFLFYERIPEESSSVLWRLTLPLFGVYFIVLLFISCFKWVITGKSYYGRKFLDGFHYKWMRKLGL